MTRILSFLFIVLSTFLYGKVEPIVFSATLSQNHITHELNKPENKDIDHPYFPEHKNNMPKVRDYPQAIGSATVIFYPSTNTVEYTIAYSGLSSPPVMIHFQLGFAQETGPIIATVIGQPYREAKGLSWSDTPQDHSKSGTKMPYGFISGTFKLKALPHIKQPLTRDQVEHALLKGGIYINIHTYLNEYGEIRGQVVPLSGIR